MWAVATTDDIDEWFAGLDEPAQVEVIAKVELLKLLGPGCAVPMRIRSRGRGTRT